MSLDNHMYVCVCIDVYVSNIPIYTVTLLRSPYLAITAIYTVTHAILIQYVLSVLCSCSVCVCAK